VTASPAESTNRVVDQRPRIVIVGAGFGGLAAARAEDRGRDPVQERLEDVMVGAVDETCR